MNVIKSFLESEATGNLFSLVTLFFAVAGGIFALVKWNKDTLLQRSEKVNELLERIRSDKDMTRCIHLFDYETAWYDGKFHGGAIEKSVDRTLSYLSYICYLREERILKKKEFDFFRYELVRTVSNRDVQDYLYNVYHFSKFNNSPMTFEYLYRFAQKEGFLDKQFLNPSPDGKKYHKYLEW